MIYSTLISYIQDTLEKVTSVKQIIPNPSETIEKYPCVIFFPESFENSFSSTSDNLKIYRFKMFIVVGAEDQTKEFLFNTVLPKVVDDVIAEFDKKWNAGNISGHRVWALLNSGTWWLTQTDKGAEAGAEMDLMIKVQTTN